MLQLPFSSEGVGEGDVRSYDSIPYRDWRYCEYPTNNLETRPDSNRAMPGNMAAAEDSQLGKTNESTGFPLEEDQHQEMKQHFNPAHNRTLRPKTLCFWHDPAGGVILPDLPRVDRPSWVVYPVDAWMKLKGMSSHPDYLFVAYATKQWRLPDNSDDPELLQFAQDATQAAGLSAFWISSKCRGPADEDGIVDEVYRMSDIVRGAACVAIAVAPPPGSRGQVVHPKNMLLGWGERMWTLPEALLSPKGKAIAVYVRDRKGPTLIEKRSLAVQVWKDAAISRQLMDHFENNLILSPLELVTIALQCLSKRDHKEVKLPGDMAYVLMGLLRRRPQIVRTDSAFQAFARLSLANDSNLLLERLVCVMPRDPYQDWYDTSDYWGVKLWDIYPTCQVAGIGQDDSVIIDGVLGGTIRWKKFQRIAYTKKESTKRSAARLALRINPLVLIGGLFLFGVGATYKGRSDFLGVGITILLTSLGIAGFSPYLVRVLFTGKLWATQPRFFGFEGYMDIETIEMHIFGASMQRLTWSPFGSTLSRHKPGDHDECIGLDPTTDPETLRLIGELYSDQNERDNRRVFTLVDTLTMTVMMFLADRPPVAVLVCGREGGMQRAVLCSYKSSTQTFCREAVVRMETSVVAHMLPVARLRFTFKRSPYSEFEDGPLRQDDFGEDLLEAKKNK